MNSNDFYEGPGKRLEDAELRDVLRLRSEHEFGGLNQQSSPKTHSRNLVLVSLALIAGISIVWATAKSQAFAAPSAPIQKVSPVGRVIPIDQSGFVPSGPLPIGLALKAQVANVRWSAGDRLKPGAQPPDGALSLQVASRVREILEYAREQTERQNLEIIPFRFKPEIGTERPSIPVNLSLQWRNGIANYPCLIPSGSSPADDKELERVAKAVAKKLTDIIGDQIEFTRANDPNLP